MSAVTGPRRVGPCAPRWSRGRRNHITASASAPAADPAPSQTYTAPRLQDIVPVCDFTFEPADGKPMQLAIDGGPLRPLPTHARLASGRHTLSVRRNADAAERRELLLCGYVSTVPIEPIK